MQIGDKTVELDNDGFLIEPQLWDNTIANAIASDEGDQQKIPQPASLRFCLFEGREELLSPTPVSFPTCPIEVFEN